MAFSYSYVERECVCKPESQDCIFSLPKLWKSKFLALASLPVREVETRSLICRISQIIATSLEMIRSFGEMLYLLGNAKEKSQSIEVYFAD